MAQRLGQKNQQKSASNATAQRHVRGTLDVV